VCSRFGATARKQCHELSSFPTRPTRGRRPIARALLLFARVPENRAKSGARSQPDPNRSGNRGDRFLRSCRANDGITVVGRSTITIYTSVPLFRQACRRRRVGRPIGSRGLDGGGGGDRSYAITAGGRARARVMRTYKYIKYPFRSRTIQG